MPDPIDSSEFAEDDPLIDENDDLFDADDEEILPDSYNDPLVFELPSV